MKFFIDTANLSQIREAQDLGVLDGVTTNPSLIKTSATDNSTNFSPSDDIVLNFSEIVKIRSGNIYIKEISNRYISLIL